MFFVLFAREGHATPGRRRWRCAPAMTERNDAMKRTALSIILPAALALWTGSCLALNTDMPKDAQEIGCIHCHAIDHKVVGPAWIEVSRRYRAKRDDKAFVEALVKKVSRGGSGNWGTVPMVANDPAGIRQDKIQGLVHFVLSLSDQLPEYQAKR
jgi:cytochrome c